MPKTAGKKPSMLSAQIFVDPHVRDAFKKLARQNGQTVASRLRVLVERDVEQSRLAAVS